jgi:hypothetical protein
VALELAKARPELVQSLFVTGVGGFAEKALAYGHGTVCLVPCGEATEHAPRLVE